MAGPVNRISTQRVDRRTSCKWEHRRRDTNQARDCSGVSPPSTCTFQPGHTLLGKAESSLETCKCKPLRWKHTIAVVLTQTRERKIYPEVSALAGCRSKVHLVY